VASSAVALVIGMLGVTNAMMMSVFERYGEIGLLAALGWRRGRILLMILCESGVVSLFGAFLGCAMCVVGALGIEALPWASGKIQSVFVAEMFYFALGAGILLGLVGCFYPAWRASGIEPREALKAL